jgi:hypothetical protein
MMANTTEPSVPHEQEAGHGVIAKKRPLSFGLRYCRGSARTTQPPLEKELPEAV